MFEHASPRRRARAVLAVLAMIAVLPLSGCGQGTAADPPRDVVVVAGDGRATVSWTAESGVDYWLFGAADASINAANWTGLPGALVEMDVASPFVVCGLANDTRYYFQLNGRRDGGPGGDRSTTVDATPRAAGDLWTANVSPAAVDWSGVGRRGALTCSSSTAGTVVNYAAVGAGGRVMHSVDGASWTLAVVPEGFTTALNAVTATDGAAAKWAAVGDQGAVLQSGDGANWTLGVAPTAEGKHLRAVASNGSRFVAVGDGGAIRLSNDAVTWNTRDWAGGQNLRAVTFLNNGSLSGLFFAVGDAGTVLISGDGGETWADTVLVSGDNGQVATRLSPSDSAELTSVAAGAYLDTASNTVRYAIVAAGKNGVILRATATASTVSLFTSPTEAGGVAGLDFVAATHYSRFLLFDASGNAWAATDGDRWSGPKALNLTAPKAAVAANGRVIAVGATGGSSLSK